MVSCPAFESVGFLFTGLRPEAVVCWALCLTSWWGLHGGAGGGVNLGLGGAGPYDLWRPCIVLVGNWS